MENDRQQLLEVVRRSQLGEGLTADQLDTVVDRAVLESYPAGSEVCLAGRKADKVYFVVQGRLSVSLPHSRVGKELIQYLSAGDHFGELALIEGREYPFDVLADEDSQLLALDDASFRQMVEDDARLATHLIRLLGFRVRETFLASHKPRQRIIGYVHCSDRAAPLLPILLAELVREEPVTLITSDARTASKLGAGAIHLAGENGNTSLAPTLHQHLSQAPAENRVLVDLRLEQCGDQLAELTDSCDMVLWLVDPHQQQPLRQAFDEVASVSNSTVSNSHVVWLLKDSDHVAPSISPPWLLTNRDFKIEMAADASQPTRLQRLGVQRLARHLRGMCIGLALGGGAARGMAHLGVLQAFDRAGIGFDMIAGTSVGAMTGIVYAAGLEPGYCASEFARQLTPPRIYDWLPNGKQMYMVRKYRTRGWNSMLRPYLQDWRLEQLQTPVYPVTVDLISACQVVRETGDAVDAMLESINLPVLAQPICKDGMALVDGGVLNNLPGSVLVEHGADLVVGVDVSSQVEFELAGNRPETPTKAMKVPGAIDTLLRIFSTQNYATNVQGAQGVDLLVEPDVSSFHLADFSRAEELAAVGAEAAQRALPEIERRIAQLSDQCRLTAAHR